MKNKEMHNTLDINLGKWNGKGFIKIKNMEMITLIQMILTQQKAKINQKEQQTTRQLL